MRTRESLERAFASYWPPAKPKARSVALAAVPEPEDRLGLGQPNGFSQWYNEGEAYGVLVRVSLGDGTTLQLKNISSEAKTIMAEYGARRFRLTLDPHQTRDITGTGEGQWIWDVER
jgi:hypothetical protein